MSAREDVVPPTPDAVLRWANERAAVSPYPVTYWLGQARARAGIGLEPLANAHRLVAPGPRPLGRAPRTNCPECGHDLTSSEPHAPDCGRRFELRQAKAKRAGYNAD